MAQDYSLSLTDIVRMLVREAASQDCIVYGVLVNPTRDAAQPFVLFSNVKETGQQLADLLHETARIIERKSAQGLITREHLQVEKQ